MKSNGHPDGAIFSRWREEWAREIARPGEEDDQERDVPLFVFCAGAEWYGISPSCIEAVMTAPVIHRLPGRQGLVAGLVNFRGKIIPTIALSELLKSGARVTRAPYLGIFNFQGWFLGFSMTEAEGIHRFSSKDLLAPPSTVAETAASHTDGMFDWEGKSVARLDAGKLEESLRREVR